jgi:phage anti-repressor protein
MTEMMLEQFRQITRSTNQYPIDFDQAWQWIGYSQKGHALKVLKANFEEGVDFDFRGSENQAGGWGGDRKSVYYFLSVDCFKSFCMMAGTDKGRKVRNYYLQIEKKYLESRVGQTVDLTAVNTFIKESVPRIKLLTSENARLHQMNRLYEKAERLQEQLARKNTPLTENEKRQILACAARWSVAEIARFTNRSETAIRRVIKRGGV